MSGGSSPVLLGSITQSSAAGVNKSGFRAFNDLVEHGLFPVEQNIKKLIAIEVWADDRVHGIKPTYALRNGNTASQLRGRDTGSKSEKFELKDNQWLVGVFGRRDAEDQIGSLSFVIFEADNGRVVVKGPWGSPPQAGKAFGTFGDIIALAGTDENSFGLCSLSLIKDAAPGGPLL